MDSQKCQCCGAEKKLSTGETCKIFRDGHASDKFIKDCMMEELHYPAFDKIIVKLGVINE